MGPRAERPIGRQGSRRPAAAPPERLPDPLRPAGYHEGCRVPHPRRGVGERVRRAQAHALVARRSDDGLTRRARGVPAEHEEGEASAQPGEHAEVQAWRGAGPAGRGRQEEELEPQEVDAQGPVGQGEAQITTTRTWKGTNPSTT